MAMVTMPVWHRRVVTIVFFVEFETLRGPLHSIRRWRAKRKSGTAYALAAGPFVRTRKYHFDME